jgi:hypothetical protein
VSWIRTELTLLTPKVQPNIDPEFQIDLALCSPYSLIFSIFINHLRKGIYILQPPSLFIAFMLHQLAKGEYIQIIDTYNLYTSNSNLIISLSLSISYRVGFARQLEALSQEPNSTKFKFRIILV